MMDYLYNWMKMVNCLYNKDIIQAMIGYVRKDTTKNIHDAVLLRFNKKGVTEWMKAFGTPEKSDQGYWIVTNADGGFTFTDYTHSYGTNGDLWIIKTNSNGN